MTNNKKISEDGKTIVRFGLGSRLAHGLHALLFVLLFITGCMIAFHGFGNLVGSEALKVVARFHKIIGIVFIMPVLILIIFSVNNFKRWIKDTFSFGISDWEFVKAYPKEFFGGRGTYPPQGRYNGGEKINSIIQIIGFIIMVATGAVMIKGSAPSAVVGWATAVHSFCGLVLGAIIMAHAYLGLLHKDSKRSLAGMITGKVSIDFAESHHPLWVEEVRKEEEEVK